MKLLVITQRVDSNNDVLGFFIGWLEALARKVDHLYVITLYEGEHHLPSNVTVLSLGKEHATSQLTRVLRFYRALWQCMGKVDKVFAHMSPIFVIAAWPVTVLRRRPIVLWYVHRSVTLRLRLASLLAHRILTVSQHSFRLKSSKIIITGHGIDSQYFKPAVQSEHSTLRLLAVGRITPIKHFETLLEAAVILRDAGLEFELKIVGQPIMQGDQNYFDKLKNIIHTHGLSMVDFVGLVPYSRIVPLYQQADIVVNLTPTGGLDKTVLEAMACEVVPLVANEAFKDYFGPYADVAMFKFQDPVSLAEHIQLLAGLDRHVIGRYMRDIIIKHHSVDQVTDHILHA